jgi:hypothetical protein
MNTDKQKREAKDSPMYKLRRRNYSHILTRHTLHTQWVRVKVSEDSREISTPVRSQLQFWKEASKGFYWLGLRIGVLKQLYAWSQLVFVERNWLLLTTALGVKHPFVL